MSRRNRTLFRQIGAKRAGEFIRLFIAPGVAHCGGAGPAPANQIDALPLVAQYRGSGSTDQASSFTCSAGL